ncbi:MAG: M48 family metallopeptidase [Planctomycetes bacterium]|nr:M48 family metallopeptidase [Planctomycetota bacterium]
MGELPYLNGYPDGIRATAWGLLQSGQLEERLLARYPDRHQVQSNKALGAYVQGLKAQYMRNAPPLVRVGFDNRLHVVHNALGIHTTAQRVQGSKLRTSRELKVASLFKHVAPEFLRMIVVHELAHIKHTDHDRDFYRLCAYMEPNYAQYELDLRLHLTVQDWKAAK